MHASLSYRRKCTSSSPNTFTSCTCSTTIPCIGSVSIFDRIDPSHTHSPAGVRIIDTLRRISCEIHLRSSIRCLVREAHAHTHPRYTRLILVLSPRIVTRIRVIGAVILTIRQSLLARIRGEPPSQFLVQNASFSSFARVVHTSDFWYVRRRASVLSFCVDETGRGTRENTPATLIRACIAKLLRCLVKTSLYYRTRARNS